ncbi:MAG: penicillin-binding protein 1A [Thermincola sp.]|jgi:1A family penicillin-binding protein|nr:penicillin-binding protein 1A [Thermincola sp.]MDT3703537.1 penicillin-binding protein 1A [Thermincola sp.]
MLKKISRSVFILLGITFLVAVAGGCSALSLPKPQMMTASRVLDINNRPVTSLFKENRVQISIKEIPEVTQNAFIAVEDVRFYRHFGLDPIRILGAAWTDIKAGKFVEGGSTITQQTAKNLFLTREKTFGRKLIEAWLAIQLEIKYTKKQILEMYLNQIYFGQGAYGIETAAQTYFGKAAASLDLAESALLAGLPKAPNTYSPFQNWQGAEARQDIVLNRMVEAGFISSEEAEKARGEKLVLKSSSSAGEGKAPYFVNEVIKYVTEKYEDGAALLFSGGLTVYTTLDLNMQKAAENSFNNGLAGRSTSLEGALVAIDPTNGYIKAMVGGRDFSRSKFNRAVQAKRQPGSAFKPFLYTAAIDLGYTQGSTLTCEPVEFPDGTGGRVYKPTDFGTTPYHYRPFTLREALAISDNVLAVKLASEIGPAAIVDYAQKLGITSKLRPYLSLALGTSEVTPLELTGAYGTLASGGIKNEPLFILKIVDKNGQVLEENKPRSQRVISETTAFLVTDMLMSVVQPGGTAGSVSSVVARAAAGKTGTTQNFHDAWFVGYTPNLTAGVYIGYDDPGKSVGATGGGLAAPIWANFIAKALQDTAKTDFSVPQDIVRVTICADSGLLATENSPKTLPASFAAGTEPQQYCGLHSYNDWFNEIVPDNDYTNPLPNDSWGFRQRLRDWFFRP